MVFDPDPGECVEKLMSCTRAEFETGLARLTGGPVRTLAADLYDLSAAAGGATVTCAFEPRGTAVLGGLMQLPRVLVTLQLADLPADRRAGFVALFEKTFQRGGG